MICTKIDKGIEMIAARDTSHMSNSYLVDGLLIEPIISCIIPPDAEGLWWKDFISTRDIEAVIVTHWHNDHVLGLQAFDAAFCLPLWAPAAPTEAKKQLIARELNNGDVLADGWVVISTPGHAREHVCLWNEDRSILIAGDMWQADGEVVIPDVGGNTIDYVHSLKHIADLHPRLVLCGHGPCDTSPSDRMLTMASIRSKVIDV